MFFSHVGENYNVGYIKEGNTAIIADMIAEATGADKLEIVPEKPYQEDYNACIEVAQQEKRANARPAVKGDIAIEDYDVIFLGYPNWWGDVPMCVYTFIDKHDWNGKTVIPFITHEGNGMAGTDSKIAKATIGSNTLTLFYNVVCNTYMIFDRRGIAELRFFRYSDELLDGVPLTFEKRSVIRYGVIGGDHLLPILSRRSRACRSRHGADGSSNSISLQAKQQADNLDVGTMSTSSLTTK